MHQSQGKEKEKLIESVTNTVESTNHLDTIRWPCGVILMPDVKRNAKIQNIFWKLKHFRPTNKWESSGEDECPAVTDCLQEVLAANRQNNATQSLIDVKLNCITLNSHTVDMMRKP